MAYNVYDRELQRLSLIDSFQSVSWSENYVGLGNFIMVLTETEDNVRVFQIGNFVKRDDSETVMIITSVVHDDAHRLTVLGSSGLHLLTRRVIDQTVTVNNAEQALRYVVSNFRPFDLLVLGDFKGYSESFVPSFDVSYSEVYELCKKICDETGLGMRMLINPRTQKLIFDVYKGENRINSIYSDVWGNLLDSQLTLSDVQYKNVAIVAGQGRDESRVIVQVGDVDSSGFDRFELYVDARDLQQEDGETLESYKNKLVARGIEKLNLNAKIFDVVVDIPFQDFGKKFNLGDFIKINIERYNLKLDIRIQSYTLKQEKNIETLTINLGVPIIRN